MSSPRSRLSAPGQPASRGTRGRAKSAPPILQVGPHRRGRVTSTSRRDPRPSTPDAALFSDSPVPAPIYAAPRAACGPLYTQRGSPQYHQGSASRPTSRALDPVVLHKITDDASENSPRKFAENWARELAALFAASISPPEMPAPHPAPDTLAQDNPRLTQIGAPQAMSMLLLVNPPFLVPHMEYARDHPSQDPANANAAGWLQRTFKDSGEAEAALLADRSRFLQQHDILPLLPPVVEKHISCAGDCAQVHGFEELFVHLERCSAAGELRKRIVAYFHSSPYLRGHLKN